jgi:hypothetical protein
MLMGSSYPAAVPFRLCPSDTSRYESAPAVDTHHLREPETDCERKNDKQKPA